MKFELNHRPLIISMMLAFSATTSNPAIGDAQSNKTIAPLKPDVPYVFIVHQGRSIKVERDVYNSFKSRNDIRASMTQNAQACPPFCLQPSTLEVPVKTVTETEIIDYMLTGLRDEKVAFIDVRSRTNHEGVTIPGSTHFFIGDVNKGPGDDEFDRKLESLGAKRHEGLSALDELKMSVGIDDGMKNESWDFTEAKTLVIWGQSAMDPIAAQAVENLYKAGYPAEKLKWYRGGLASWQYWGFNTVSKPKRR